MLLCCSSNVHESFRHFSKDPYQILERLLCCSYVETQIFLIFNATWVFTKDKFSRGMHFDFPSHFIVCSVGFQVIVVSKSRRGQREMCSRGKIVTNSASLPSCLLLWSIMYKCKGIAYELSSSSLSFSFDCIRIGYTMAPSKVPTTQSVVSDLNQLIQKHQSKNPEMKSKVRGFSLFLSLRTNPVSY